MSESNKVQEKQTENVEFEQLNQLERLVLRMFRQLAQQRQRDILKFIAVLLNAQ